MTVWAITALLAFIVAAIVFAEVKCGRRTKDFLETIGPEIDQLRTKAVDKYRERFGRDPTGAFTLLTEPPKPARRRWFKR